MIDAKHLMIGNWVNAKDAEGNEKQIQITAEMLFTIASNAVFASKISGIRLNPYWLKEFGFVGEFAQIERSKLFAHPDISFMQLLNASPIVGGFNIVGGRFDTKTRKFSGCTGNIEFVHQLQNYFAICGKEAKREPTIDPRIKNEKKIIA